MKICYLANSQLPSQVANSVHVVNMASALAANGAEVTLMALRSTQAGAPQSVREICDYYGVPANFRIDWLPNPLARGRSLLSGIAAWRALRRLRPDLALGRHAKGCYAAALAGIPTLYETHKPHSARSAGDRFCLDRLVRSPAFRGLVTISEPLKKILLAETGVPAERILAAPDAATLPEGVQPADLGGQGELKVGYVGAFHPGRGIELVLQMARDLPQMNFHLIGGRREDMESRQGDAPELANVTFHGFQPPRRAAELRLGCDVLLAPYSRSTTVKGVIDTTAWMSPLKVFEYMAAAKPILCSDLPVLHEVLEHGRNALLLSPDDAGPWVEALRRLQAEPAEAAALGRRAFEDFESHYTWRQRARRIVAFGEA